jgi:hypothetical protein
VLHGVALIDAVIAKVKRDGALKITKPTPAKLARLKFPNGKPLSPALERWLAFDASWLGWFADPTKPVFRPRTLGDYTIAEYDFDWGFGQLGFDGEVYGFEDAGSESRRLLYVGEPDSIGEYPVLVTDSNSNPYITVEYPGIDVYLAVMMGLVKYNMGVYGAMLGHPVYGARMKQHAARYFAGKNGGQVEELVGDPRALWASLSEANADRIAAAKQARAKPATRPKARAKPTKKPAGRRRRTGV